MPSPCAPFLDNTMEKVDAPPDIQSAIQTQLADLLHGQERLERIMMTFSNNSSFATPRHFANGTFRSTPRSGGIRASRVSQASKVKLCQVATAKGDASVTPRFSHPDETNGVDGLKPAPYTILEHDEHVAKMQTIDEDMKKKILSLHKGSTASLFDEDMIAQGIEATFEESRSATERSKQRLKKLLRYSHEVKLKEKEKEKKVQNKRHNPLTYVYNADAHKKEVWFDAVVQIVIILNTLFIGVSLDYKHANDWNFWLITDMVFTTVFIFELVVKLFLHGFKSHFLGKDKISNMFDFLIIAVDGFQLVQTLGEIGKSNAQVRSASVFRVLRLLRIVRIIRAMKFHGMRAFVDMLQGVLDGAATLFWAILMFMLMVYCGGILCKICFGTPTSDEEEMRTVYPYFKSVSRSMLTVFRCSFGDCSTAGGTPIPEFILEENGKEYALGYCLFLFFITIGLFNIISAIFVDSTMNASSAVQTAMKNERLNSNKLWATSVSVILTELLTYQNDMSHDLVDLISPESMEVNFEKLIKVEFTRSTIEQMVQHNHKVQEALDGLDIEPTDHKRLSDILDPDHSGTIDVLELVEGLRCLRGDPRRSDVVTCDLMIRSLQAKTEEVLAEVLDSKERLEVLEQHALAGADLTKIEVTKPVKKEVAQAFTPTA